MDEFDLKPSPDPIRPPIRGRGAAANIAHRYSREERIAEADGWDNPPPPAPQTQLFTDASRSILSRNDSPDLAFEVSVNPYRGCEHGCIYCYARPTHAWLGLSPGLDFETRIFAKPDAPRLLREAFAQKDYRCTSIALGAATDAYQPSERHLEITRELLKVFLEHRHPLTISTKSSLIVRDLDLLTTLAEQNLVQVAVSLSTLDGNLARKLEPRASAPAARLKTIEKLATAGVPVSAFVAPLIPGLNDHELEKLLEAAKTHGARDARYILLRLPHEVAGLFREWLAQHVAGKAAKVMAILYDLRGQRADDPDFHTRMTGLGHYAELIRQRFDLACRRLAISQMPVLLDTRKFKAPAPQRPGAEKQLPLF